MPPKSPRTNKSSPEPRARSPPHEVGRSASSRSERAGWGGGANFASPRSGEVGARSAPGGESAPISPPHAVGRSAPGGEPEPISPPRHAGRSASSRSELGGWGVGANFASPRSGEVGARSAPGGESAPIS